MTEYKRFTIEKDYDCDGNWEYCYYDNETYRRFNFADEYCHTEFLELVNAIINRLSGEIEELKKSQTSTLREFRLGTKKVQKLINENEGLRQTIKSVYELLTIQVDVFTDEAVKNDNIAYKELLKLDNKDANIMATATKQAIKLLKMELK